MHPLINQLLVDKILYYSNLNKKLIIYDAALIFETNIQKNFNDIILTNCKYNIQLKRLMNRNSISKTYAQQCILSQMPQNTKKKLTNYIIDTNSNINKTINSFNAIWKKITKKYKL
jgi:dephospho-CoA kinase